MDTNDIVTQAKVHNFSAGPSILPDEVLKQASEACLSFGKTGLSILTISHRSKDFIAVMDEARHLVKELYGLGDDYEVLFLGGGASTQFAMVPYNLLTENGFASYLKTGIWAGKAIKEARVFGTTQIVASSEDKNFSYIPKKYVVSSNADYFHCTSNNTIHGTQMKSFPTSPVPMVCDMSSDIFSRVINAKNFGIIYAGAQKNLGPAGCTVVIIRKDILGQPSRSIPSMLDYSMHIKAGSMYNTPPVFPVYVSMPTLRWLKLNSGLPWIEQKNWEKADALYAEIDRNPLFAGVAQERDRSMMNATFTLTNSGLKEEFDKMVKSADISGINGHRDVGGYRASLYNAQPIASVRALIDVMRVFERKFA